MNPQFLRRALLLHIALCLCSSPLNAANRFAAAGHERPNFLFLFSDDPFPIEAGFDGRDEILAPYPRTPEQVRVHLQEYYAIIAHLDAEIGRILAALETSGKAANTVIIFTSDQGLAVGQHGLMDGGTTCNLCS